METTKMQRRVFGRTKLMVSPLGFGAAPIGFLKTDIDRVGRILNLLLDSGVNLIDTAASYPGSEEALGQTVSHRRNEFVLVSKCGQKFDDLPGEAWSPQVISATVDRALKRLRTDHLDVMLLHSCDLETLKTGETIGALAKAREAGKIRFAGYSGDNEAAEYAAGLPDIAVIETSVNFVDQANIAGVLPIARQNQVAIIAKRPIANAAWRSVEAQKGMYQEYARPYHERFASMALRLEEFATDGVGSFAELALRFTLSQPGVHTGIIGTTNPENARENIRLAAKPPLSAGSIRRIQDAFAHAEREAGRKWPGLT